ncbi:GIP [Symbiodinium sp. CCMP2592]|nr:GIP [Symbiodinium sp. CCMP2592]
MEYAVTGNVTAGQAAIDKSTFMNYKEVMKECLVVAPSKRRPWDLMKQLDLNRRCRKRLYNSPSWVVRWDAPSVERRKDPMKHMSQSGDSIYVNVNTLLIGTEFEDVWKVLIWAATSGKISAVVAADCSGKPMDQIVAAPHRSKVHFFHAAASAGRTVRGQGVVRLFVEDLDKAARQDQEDDPPTWPAWTRCVDTLEYMTEMGLFDISISQFTGERYVKLAKLDGDAAWRLHVMRGHQPFRRDCSVCVRNSASGRQHRTTMHPMAYSLSVDVVGPLKGYGKSPDGKFFKYFVIGAFRIPQVEGAHGHPEVRGHPIPADDDSTDDEDQLSEEEEADDGPVESDHLDEAQVDREKEQWKQLLATFKEPIATNTIYFAVPVNNKKAASMLPAVQKIVMDVKALGYPVTRLHSDRGGEFRGHLVRRWALSQGMWPTTTSGSESASNGVAEAGVRYLKRRARILLDSGKVSKENWPTAVQYAAAQQRSDQLGVLSPLPVAYGTKVYVKTKKYKTGAVEDFGHHWVQGRYVGPSTDIRGGHVILKQSGTFVQTTHVRITQDPPSLDEVAPVVLVEEPVPLPNEAPEPPLPPPPGPPPATRLREKTPSVAYVGETYESSVGLSEIRSLVGEADEAEPIMKYLRVEEIQYVEAVAEQLFKEEKYEAEDVERIMGQGLILGAFVHGGSFGVTRYGRDLPWVTKYLNHYVRQKIEKAQVSYHPTWTTIAVQCADQIPRHRDVHNERGTYNYVCEIKRPPSAGLWVEDKGGERRVVGGSDPRDHQIEGHDGVMYDGCLLEITEKPAVFDPLVPHAYVKDDNKRWFISAYTPQGAPKLKASDKEYLERVGFPLSEEEEEERQQASGALETRPVLKATSLPSGTLSGAHVQSDDVDAATIGDCDETLWDWAMYVENEFSAGDADEVQANAPGLRKVCGSDDPGCELPMLIRKSDVLVEEESGPNLQDDFAGSLEYWNKLGVLQDVPRVAKLEPEYTDGVEDIISEAVRARTPLRHTYNVSPKEARSVIEKWRPAISKEVGVVEKGFKRIHVKDIEALKAEFEVQELPSKLVYTVKPPTSSTTTATEDESSFCRRKARIVCCGNFADGDAGDIFAGGAAAESLRCALTYTTKRRWIPGIVDVTGAFMLTPLPGGRGAVWYIIRPPAALVQLGLAEESERWLLTHGMYGLRQSPRLWQEFRDSELKQMKFDHEGRTWSLKQGQAEPNLWLVYEVGAPADQESGGLILVYVDDIMLAGPLSLVKGMASTIGKIWKVSELDVLSADHDIRFLGCEIATNENMDCIYVHQRPYINEILRHHEVPPQAVSYIQAPRELVTFEAFEGEERGTDSEIKEAQRLCGELLWLAQRSRPDVAYVVSAMGSLLSRAAPRCIAIGVRLLSYLQQTRDLALTLRSVSDELVAYSDSSFAPSGARSFSGVVLTWMGSPITWRAAKQPFVCLSTAECELVAAIEALSMAKSLESVIKQVDPSSRGIVLGIDNQATIAIAKPTTTASWRTRHLRVRAAYIHEQIEFKEVTVRYVPGKEQWADLLTKSFPRQRLQELTSLWGFLNLVQEAARVSMVRAMVFCMMVQTSRAQPVDEEPLALTASFELYVMVILLGVAVVAAWEFLWWCVDRCCGEVRPSRSARRLRGLQETIQREIEIQMAERQSTPEQVPQSPLDSSPPTRTRSSRITPQSSPAPRATSSMSTVRTQALETREVGTQLDSSPLICYQDRPVPTPVPDPINWNYPLYVSPTGDTYHTYENCWGLRNTRARPVRFCQCCRDNQGRSLRDR